MKKLDGAARIALERDRQVSVEAYTPDHDDDEHSDGSLAMAAACYAATRPIFTMARYAASVAFQDPWPFKDVHDKRPHVGNVLKPAYAWSRPERIRLLEKAGALIAAEIDRLLRAEEKKRKKR